MPSPKLPATSEPHNLLITGVGGMGVITLGALVGMAAHLDGKGVSVLDMTGLAQKYGAVFSHLRIADRPEDIHAARIATGEAHAILGGDLVVSAGSEALSKMLEGRTQAVISSAETPTADFTRQRDWRLPAEQLKQRLRDTLGDDATHFIDAKHLATRLMGDALYANILLLGYAWQRGLIPVSLAALDRAIELNGTAIDANRTAFMWGRRAAVNPEKLAKLAGPAMAAQASDWPLDTLIAHRAAHLTAYQDAALAQRYLDRLTAIRQLNDDRLSRHVAEQYARLLAPKDEYEVARLYTETGFLERLRADFDGDFSIQLHLSPPGLAGTGPDGRPRKRRFAPWLLPVLRLVARARSLRGSWLDPFRFSAEKQLDHRLLADYEADLDLLLEGRQPPDAALELASWPAEVRGYGPVRRAALPSAHARRNQARNAIRGERAA